MIFLLLPFLLVNDELAKPFTEGKERIEGFFDLVWDPDQGELFLSIDQFEQPFLLVESLATGLGSNDIGLDRGQLGRNRIVYFRRIGKKIFLVEENLQYRALSEREAERRAVRESFASSILWGTEVVAEEDKRVYVNLSSLVFRDEKKVIPRLKNMGEGSYKIDASRCHYFMERTRSFPDNTEIEGTLTFTGQPQGRLVGTVAPTPESFSLRQHFSLVRLPDSQYKTREFHPRSGGFYTGFRDYAAPLDADLDLRFVVRHRLVPKNPRAKRSRLVEPLIYYVDAGAPPEIQEALIEGASWWSKAFDAAGFIDGFQVRVLPPDVDPMDVRYNVIQWVHRSTRGWSYGGSVFDPRTGEIIKGHVTLGSLRVRQDRLLFEGMIPFDENGKPADGNPRPVDLALARIRQLSAHEVGHTLGLAHNFAASNLDRASVMDYPAPLVTLAEGQLDFSSVYGVGVGTWDLLAIRYLYQHFADEKAGLAMVIEEAERQKMPFIADQDSRAGHSLHPQSNLWDNGAESVAEFERILALRDHLLKNFGPKNLRSDTFLARLEEVLVPVYLHHRFQIIALIKNLGGATFDYGVNDGKSHLESVSAEQQKKALSLALETLSPQFLQLPDHLIGLIPPRPPGYGAHRELFDRRTGRSFDPLSLAETSVEMTLGLLFLPERLNRIHSQQLFDPGQLGLDHVLEGLLKHTVLKKGVPGRQGAYHRLVNYSTVNHLVNAAGNTKLRESVRARLFSLLVDLENRISEMDSQDSQYRVHYQWLKRRLSGLEKLESLATPSVSPKTPPGSPIGTVPEPF